MPLNGIDTASPSRSDASAYFQILAVNAIWHIGWADPLAALAITPLIVLEGSEAVRGKACCAGDR